MANLSNTSVPHQPRRTSTTKRLIQAAALASALVPLGAVAVEADVINCVTNETSGGSGGCFAVTGEYTSGGVEQSNVWKFYQSLVFNPETEEDELQNLLYTFEIRGVPDTDSSFSLDVDDEWIDVGSESYDIDFPDSQCTPLLDDQNNCVIFDVSTVAGLADWDDTYYIEIRWFADPLDDPGDVLNKPPDDGRNHIFRAESGNFFDDVLETELYDPELLADPEDPALGGRGSNFSRFIAGRATIPEPSTLLLLGTGIAAALYRRRKIG